MLAGVAIIVSPGPATVLVAATGASFGLRSAYRLIAGLVSSMVIIAVAIGSGLTSVVALYPAVLPVLSLTAVVYMLYLAYRIATAPPIVEPGGHPPTFWSGFVLNFINPKAYAAVAALFGGFVLVDSNPIHDAVLKGGGMIGIIVIGHSLWALGGAVIARVVRRRQTFRRINVGFAVALVAAVLASAFGLMR